MLNLLMGITGFLLTNFYTLQFTDVDGNPVNMGSYQNKKILIVNIATGSPRVSQLAGLQQLQETYGDSLIVIAFPSNSFANEGRDNAEIKQFCQNNYGATFKIAAKNPVSGTGIQAVYNWLAHTAENGVMDGWIGRDFQKFLIDKEGSLMGIFAPSVEPLSPDIINAILQ